MYFIDNRSGKKRMYDLNKHNFLSIQVDNGYPKDTAEMWFGCLSSQGARNFEGVGSYSPVSHIIKVHPYRQGGTTDNAANAISLVSLTGMIFLALLSVIFI